MSPNLDLCFPLPPARGDLAGGTTYVAVRDLNIVFSNSLVIVVSPMLIDASTLPGIDGATLLALFACW